MSVIAGLQVLRMVAFIGLAVLTFGLWRRQRSRPAMLLAGVFGFLALVLVLGVVSPTAAGPLGKPGRDITVVSLLWVPWLLAAFAWSFDDRMPRWLRQAAIALAVISVWKLVLPPLPPPGQPREGAFVAFTWAFIGSWTALMLLACQQLWRSGGGQLVVRSRMRTMTAGAFVLNLALLAAGWVRPERASAAYLAILLLSLLAAALFLIGFAPPRFLREWWRRRAYAGWHQMQTDLVASATPGEVAEAVVPMLTEVIGGAVAVLSRTGPVLAHRGFTDGELGTMQTRVAVGDRPGDADHAFTADNCWLVLRPSVHSPLFGAHEIALIEGFTLHLRLALERAELYEANLEAMRVLERSSQETETMLVGLSHDLRSPAMTIAGYSDLLCADPVAGDRDQLISGLAESSRYLGRLLESLLELATIGRHEPQAAPVELTSVLQSTVARLSVAYPGLRVHVDERLPAVLGAPLRLEQVFTNLLRNAANHGGRDPITVTVSCEQAASVVRITIGDDGQGIDEADRAMLFTPFRRGRNATTQGNGVGLGLVKRIVETMGGTIRLAEQIDGDAGGASFEIELFAASVPDPSGSHVS